MIDSNGLIVQENGDGGDCPCRCGVVIGAQIGQGNAISMLANIALKFLQKAPGVFIRHPVTYTDTKNFSRDQASRLMLGLGLAKLSDPLIDYYWHLITNYLRHPNGDLLGLSEVSAFIRIFDVWIFYPLLLILDIQFFVNIISWRWQPWDTDNLFIMDLWYANKKMITPWSYLAAKLYDKKSAKTRIEANLNSGDPGLTCKEAFDANIWFLEQM